MTVVLRCSSCGTTRSAPGECEACHEAQVRYFCTNHKPGIWLDGGTCRQCGARFGDVARRPSAAPPSVTARSRPPGAPRAPAAIAAVSRPSVPRSLPVDEADGEWVVRERSPRPDEELRTGLPAMALWVKLLKDAAARSRRSSPVAEPSRGRPAIAGSLGGCLMRLVLIAMCLFLALVIGLFLFGRSLLQSVTPY